MNHMEYKQCNLCTLCFIRDLSTVYTVKNLEIVSNLAANFLAQMNLLSHAVPYGLELKLFFILDYYLTLYPISYLIYFCLSSYLFRMPKMNLDYKISKKHRLP